MVSPPLQRNRTRTTRKGYYRRNARGNPASYTRYKNRVIARANTSSYAPYVSIHPNRMLVKMRFALNAGEGHALASTSGAVVDYPYRANSLYDPYAGSGGAQPRNFDQLMTMYAFGVVIKSTIHVSFIYPEGSATNNSMCVGVRLMNTTGAMGGTSEANIAEGTHTRFKLLTVGSDKQVVRYTYNPHKFFGIKDTTDEKDLHFSNTADSSRQAGFHVWAYGVGSLTQTCRAIGYIDYTCILFEPVTPSQS